MCGRENVRVCVCERERVCVCVCKYVGFMVSYLLVVNPGNAVFLNCG